MCTAIIKPANVLVPSELAFRNCFIANSDGAGYAYGINKKFVIRKGFMTIEAFLKSLKETISKYGEEWAKATPMMFHFRIGTHGSNDDPKHTHPFPLTKSAEMMEQLVVKCDTIIMHNGILNRWGSSAYSGKGLSDTMDFIQNFVSPVQTLMGETKIFDSKIAQDLISKEVAGSRFVIMESGGRFVYWGDWVKEQGCMYSNRGFETTARVTYVYKSSKSSYKYNSEYWDNYLDGDCTEEKKHTPLLDFNWVDMKFIRSAIDGSNIFLNTKTKKFYTRVAPFWDWKELEPKTLPESVKTEFLVT